MKNKTKKRAGVNSMPALVNKKYVNGYTNTGANADFGLCINEYARSV